MAEQIIAIERGADISKDDYASDCPVEGGGGGDKTGRRLKLARLTSRQPRPVTLAEAQRAEP